jgi:hypothetical protein
MTLHVRFEAVAQMVDKQDQAQQWVLFQHNEII